jgi:hypothetical protein
LAVWRFILNGNSVNVGSLSLVGLNIFDKILGENTRILDPVLGKIQKDFFFCAPL